MSDSEKLYCKWSGCPYGNWSYQRMRTHEAREHTECVCGRYFAKETIDRHQRRCSAFQAVQWETKRAAHSKCFGCAGAISEGQCYLFIPALLLQTMVMDDDALGHNSVEATAYDIVLCGPDCLTAFIRTNGLLRDVLEE